MYFGKSFNTWTPPSWICSSIAITDRSKIRQIFQFRQPAKGKIASSFLQSIVSVFTAEHLKNANEYWVIFTSRAHLENSNIETRLKSNPQFDYLHFSNITNYHYYWDSIVPPPKKGTTFQRLTQHCQKCSPWNSQSRSSSSSFYPTWFMY